MQTEQIGRIERRTSAAPLSHEHFNGHNGSSHSNGLRWLRVGLETMALIALVERTLSARPKHRAGLIATTTALAGVTVLDALAVAKGHQAPPVRIRASVTVNRSPEDVYSFWRDFKNLPNFMRHLDEVDEFDGLTIWRAVGPGGVTLQWDAAIVAERPNERIAWRSLEGARVQNYGSVTFTPGPRGRGTEVHVQFGFEPPFGAMGTAIVKLLGSIPSEQLYADLRRFKQVMETGEVATSDASIHRRMHSARPPKPEELPLVKGMVQS